MIGPAIQELLPDIAAVTYSCGVFVLVTLYWIHRTHPARISRTFGNLSAIAIRVFLLHAVVLMCLLPFEGLAVSVMPWLTLAGLCVLPFARIQAIPGGGSSAYSISKMLMIPFYGLRQFVLGFPDRDVLMNRYPEAELYSMDESPPIWSEDE